jgi:hypothetical protein
MGLKRNGGNGMGHQQDFFDFETGIRLDISDFSNDFSNQIWD